MVALAQTVGVGAISGRGENTYAEVEVSEIATVRIIPIVDRRNARRRRMKPL